MSYEEGVKRGALSRKVQVGEDAVDEEKRRIAFLHCRSSYRRLFYYSSLYSICMHQAGVTERRSHTSWKRRDRLASIQLEQRI